MARQSRLPRGGENLFQKIKKVCAEAEADGQKLIKLSIGQPQGPALPTARKAAAEAVMSDKENMHEYQDNGCIPIPDFAQEFIQFHCQTDLSSYDVAYLPIPGIKPMLEYIIQACGTITGQPLLVRTMTDPGYPTPEVVARELRQKVVPLTTNKDNNFLPDPEELSHVSDLVMLNFPTNPTGQVCPESWWRSYCDYCEKHNIRLFNDAAYAALTHTKNCQTLSDVAVNYPHLSWAEACSASKVINNGTGWRIGAMVGSPDFISDIAKVKGNRDSGFFAPAAYGVYQQIMDNAGRNEIKAVKNIYKIRLGLLIEALTNANMRIACLPSAGFFTLWDAPMKAFGQTIDNDAEKFNYLMIQKTGIVGVHFGKYIRYAVVSPIEKGDTMEKINNAFMEADVKY